MGRKPCCYTDMPVCQYCFSINIGHQPRRCCKDSEDGALGRRENTELLTAPIYQWCQNDVKSLIQTDGLRETWFCEWCDVMSGLRFMSNMSRKLVILIKEYGGVFHYEQKTAESPAGSSLVRICVCEPKSDISFLCGEDKGVTSV